MSAAQDLHLVIHSGYHEVFIALYDRTTRIDVMGIDKKSVSAFLVSSIMQLLQHHQRSFSDLSFIGVHAGPAPFTTLRVGIATANGLSFATRIPLIPVSGLEILSKTYPEYTVLLNAFCDDVYVGKNGVVSCENIDTFLQKELVNNKLTTYIGNGTHLHQEKIKEVLKDNAKILADYPYEASIDDIAHEAYRLWQQKTGLTDQVIPAYLKAYSAKLA